METTLKSVLQDKITAKIAERQAKVQIGLAKIEQEGSTMNDFIAPLGAGGKVRFTANGRTYMNLDADQYTMHSHALSQAAEKLKVPAAYINSLQGTDWGRQLGADTLNRFTEHTTRQRLLVRTVGDEVRGVLSRPVQEAQYPTDFR